MAIVDVFGYFVYRAISGSSRSVAAFAPNLRYHIRFQGFFLAVSFLTLFMLTRPYSNTIAAMRFYKVPEILVTMISLTLRYIHLMFSELYRMLLARKARMIEHPTVMDKYSTYQPSLICQKRKL